MKQTGKFFSTVFAALYTLLENLLGFVFLALLGIYFALIFLLSYVGPVVMLILLLWEWSFIGERNLLISEQATNKKIIFITGRHEKYRQQTKHWLEKYFNFSIELFMRADHDKRNKVIVKQELFLNNLDKKNILYVIDDDNDLLSMWKTLGLKCVDAKKFI